MDNSKTTIKRLLDNFWAGDSTLEDEIALHSYFNQADIDEEFKVFEPLFRYYASERSMSINLEEEIMSKISNRPTNARIISIGWRKVVAIAASFMLLLTVGIGLYRQNTSNLATIAMSDTFQTPEEALEQTKAALLYLSSRMNKATDKATKSISKTQNLNILN